MMEPLRDVLREDRLLLEFWLNHGVDREALRRRLADLRGEGNAAYLAANALYGCFEMDLLRLAEGEAGAGGGSSLNAALKWLAEGPAPKVTPASPEGRLLALLSLRPAPGSEAAEEAVRLARGPIRWEAFARAAGRANVVPPVAASIGALGLGGAMPAARAAWFGSAAEGIRGRSLRILALLEDLLGAFAEAGLSPVLLKETALLGHLYRDPGDRAVGDLDVLFSHGEVDEAERVLTSRGYVPFEGIWSKAWYRAHHHHLAPLVGASEAVKIEPHTGIWLPTGSAAPIIPELLASSVPHPRLRARRPSASHMIFHLLVDLHGNASIGKLGQAADAALLLLAEGKEIEAGLIEDLARRTGAGPYLEDSLDLLARLHGAAFLEKACPPLVPMLERAAPTLERRLLRRLAAAQVCGFEPRASALSLAGVRLVHKTLLAPGGRARRLGFMLRAALGAPRGEEGMGAIARRSRSGAAVRAARVATWPLRAAARAVRARLRRA